MRTQLSWPAYLAHIEGESTRFVDALAGASGNEPVPTCPEWTADDLLDHLRKVQAFWSRVVGDGLTTRAEADAVQEPARPTARTDLVAQFRSASASLVAALRATEPGAPRWSWSVDQTAGFSYRRQAHEALIHRLDAELTVGRRTPFDPALATDGIDEALRVMFGGCPDWGTITPIEGRTARLRASDTDASWLVTMARFTGTDPEGTTHDEPDISIAQDDDGRETAAAIEGTAEDLDCWLWNRPPVDEVRRSGDDEVLTHLEEIFAQEIR